MARVMPLGGRDVEKGRSPVPEQHRKYLRKRGRVHRINLKFGNFDLRCQASTTVSKKPSASKNY